MKSEEVHMLDLQRCAGLIALVCACAGCASQAPPNTIGPDDRP